MLHYLKKINSNVYPLLVVCTIFCSCESFVVKFAKTKSKQVFSTPSDMFLPVNNYVKDEEIQRTVSLLWKGMASCTQWYY